MSKWNEHFFYFLMSYLFKVLVDDALVSRESANSPIKDDLPTQSFIVQEFTLAYQEKKFWHTEDLKLRVKFLSSFYLVIHFFCELRNIESLSFTAGS